MALGEVQTGNLGRGADRCPGRFPGHALSATVIHALSFRP